MGGGANESNIQANPYYQQSAGQTWNATQDFAKQPNYAQNINSQFASPLYNPLLNPTSFNPQSLVNTGNNITQHGANLYNYGDAVMGIGLDPNMKQYGFYNQQVMDAMNAQNANAGISTTPYGSGVMGQTEANFANQWAMNASQKADAALNAASGAYNTGANMQGAGQELAMAAPTFQLGALQQYVQQMMQNYALPEQNIQNQLAYMSAANAQNATSVQSATQQNQAAQLNSPFSFLGSLFGRAAGSNGFWNFLGGL